MATLIYVHGTFATGPEKGDKWWQRGSAFDRRMHELVAADAGGLAIERIIWDGDNLESARRRAGKELHQKMLELEASEEPYCLIGHSHGGSVIAAGLMLAALNNQPLTYMRRWITVGTPFVEPQKDGFLFSRLGLLGKAMFVAIATFAFFAAWGISSSFDEATSIAITIGVVAILPLLAVYFALLILSAREHWRFEGHILSCFNESFARTWFGLWHKDDEAIGGLKALGTANRQIFRKDFAVPILSFVAIIVFPFFVYAALANSDLAIWMFEQHMRMFGVEKLEAIMDTTTLKGGGKDVGINYVLLLTISGEAFASLYPGEASSARAVFLIGVVPVTYLVLSLLSLFLVRTVSGPVSAMLSGLFDTVTWCQLRQAGYGNDVSGEASVAARASPIGMSKCYPPLPRELSDELTEKSDTAAANALSKLRGAIHTFAFSEDGAEKRVIDDYLTWDELVHTNYFDVDCVRKLIAFAVAEAKGFEATAKFKHDYEFTQVRNLYHILEAESERSQSVVIEGSSKSL